jgi:hypothetical protein
MKGTRRSLASPSSARVAAAATHTPSRIECVFRELIAVA